MKAHYQLRNVQSGYNGTVALELADLAIRAHRLNLITGPNGCGKSTLLQVLAFLKQPERGEVVFGEQPVRWGASEARELRQRVTLVQQAPYLFAGSVARNVGYGLKLRGVSGTKLRNSVSDALSMVSLPGFEERDVRQLSGGEARRVALARALALCPEVLLLDEPLASLDAHSTAVMERLLGALPAWGTTVVMSTHDLTLAERVECEVIRLVNGRVVQSQEVEVCRPLMMPAF